MPCCMYISVQGRSVDTRLVFQPLWKASVPTQTARPRRTRSGTASWRCCARVCRARWSWWAVTAGRWSPPRTCSWCRSRWSRCCCLRWWTCCPRCRTGSATRLFRCRRWSRPSRPTTATSRSTCPGSGTTRCARRCWAGRRRPQVGAGRDTSEWAIG